MLSRLDTDKHEIPCIDAAEQLDKLNKDCSNTAGLEANLKLAVGARVIIDTKSIKRKKKSLALNAGMAQFQISFCE